MKCIRVSMLFVMFFSLIAFVGCNNAKKKENKTEERQTEIKELKKEFKADSIKVVNEAEWVLFKTAAEIKIKANAVKVKELRKKLQKHGKVLDTDAEQQLNDLEKKNEELQKRINEFKKEGTDWGRFKSDFDRELDQVHSSLKDFKIAENKK